MELAERVPPIGLPKQLVRLLKSVFQEGHDHDRPGAIDAQNLECILCFQLQRNRGLEDMKAKLIPNLVFLDVGQDEPTLAGHGYDNRFRIYLPFDLPSKGSAMNPGSSSIDSDYRL